MNHLLQSVIRRHFFLLLLVGGISLPGLTQTALPDPGSMSGYRGNNGSSYLILVTVPDWAPLWGTQFYTDDSNIGMAAGHWYGLSAGNRYVVQVTVSAGRASYSASTRFGITSLDWEAWPGSFYFSNYYNETLPGVTTNDVGGVAIDSAQVLFSNSGMGNGTSITERGVCYNTTGTPTIADSKITSGTGTGTSDVSMTDLLPLTTYYVRAFATNDLGQTGYGAQLSFTTLVEQPVINSFTPESSTPGSTVTISGTNFFGVTAVSFGDTPATSFTVESPASISAVVGAGSSGNVSVTNPGGTAVLAGFTYVKLNQAIVFDELNNVTYGGESFTVSAAGGASGNPVTFTSADPSVATCSGTNGATITILKAGSTSIYANQEGNASYSAAPQVAQSLTVDPALLAITGVTAENKEYDGTTTAALSGGLLSGILGEDEVTFLAGTGDFADKNAGSDIPVIASGYTLDGTDAGNYALEAQPAGIEADITPVDLSAKAEDKTRAYGDEAPEFTIAYTGLVPGDTPADITEPVAECAATQTSDTGKYDIVLSGGESGNYIISLSNGILTVEKAMLTVTAQDESREVGEENPEFTLVYDGFRNEENTEVLDTLPVVSCIADTLSEAGDYDIVVEGGSDNHYYFTYVTGTLTVVAEPTGIYDASTHGYSVFPNPVAESLRIISPASGAVQVRVFDAMGRLVINTKVENGTLDVHSLPAGLYNVRVNNASFKLIKK